MTFHDLLENLSRAEAFPEGKEPPVVHQTHLSAVFVIGDFAYKVRKPVHFAFVDFSTLEKRRADCEAEIACNRRLAPDVYLDVVPIALTDGGLKVEGDGPPVEYAVKMRRLDDRRTLAARLRAGEGLEGTIERLARRLAEWHSTCERGPQISEAATLERVAEWVRGNFTETAAHVGRIAPEEVHRRAAAASEQAMTDVAALIEARAARGVPCDGHGDLRLDHVYLFDERPLPADVEVIDAVEFEPRLRWSDPISDAAFLAMELTAAGRPDLSRLFRQSYLEASGDAEGARLFPFYMAYRAAVRAKVAGLAALDKDQPPEDRERAERRALARWLLVLATLEPPDRRPSLVLVGGLPGVGKSTAARGVARSAGLMVVRSDEVRKELAASAGVGGGRSDLDAGIYSALWNQRTLEECLRRAEALLRNGGRVLIDSTFREEHWRRRFLDLAAELCIPAAVLICRLDDAEALRRLAARRNDVSDADERVYQALRDRWEPASPQTLRAMVELDASGSEVEVLQNALAALQNNC